MYTVDWLLSSEVEQDNEYIVMKLSNSDEEYKMISFNSDDDLSKDQKISSSVTVNKFYSEIWSMEKEYSSELWNAAYENILETLQKKVTSIEYEKRIALLWWQIILMNQKIMKTCKFQQAYEECYEIFKKRKFLLFSDFAKHIEWIWEIFNSIMYQEEQRYSDIVREYSSIKAWFTKNKEYVTAENDYVLWVMWMKVWAVRQEYVQLDSRMNLKNYVNFIKFNYLKSVKSRVKN